MHYLVIGYDHPGDVGKQRRAAAREAHLAQLGGGTSARALFGAAVLDDSGGMIGSMLVMDAENRAALQAWLDKEPYVVGDVWREVTVQPCQVPPTFLSRTGVDDGNSAS